jgi:glycerol uptake facilitator-like aquaporin
MLAGTAVEVHLFFIPSHPSQSMVFLLSLLSSIYQYLNPLIPPGLIICLASAFVGDNHKHLSTFKDEFIGTLLMIGLTFSPGKWIGSSSKMMAWTAHAVGVVAADKLGGGQHVNPGVTLSMFALGKCSYTEGYTRIMGSMAGGLVAFPLYKLVATTFHLTPLGGPEFIPTNDQDGLVAGLSEFLAMILLCFLIYVVNWELNFGRYHYWIKQTLTALGIRYLIETFPRAGPAINPMLATTWYIFAYGDYPSSSGFYFTYWVSSFAGAIVASYVYAIYAGGTVFGMTLPLGPIKGSAATIGSKKNN